jgi:hypothetical protein
MVQRSGFTISYLNDAQRTPEVCLAAVKTHGDSIAFLNDAQRTPEVCRAAAETFCAARHMTEAQKLFLTEAQRLFNN